jgi:hypothetical protein
MPRIGRWGSDVDAPGFDARAIEIGGSSARAGSDASVEAKKRASPATMPGIVGSKEESDSKGVRFEEQTWCMEPPAPRIREKAGTGCCRDTPKRFPDRVDRRFDKDHMDNYYIR